MGVPLPAPKRLLVAWSLLAAVVAVGEGSRPAVAADRIAAVAADTTALAAVIRDLTAPELAGRGAGTPEERQAAALIAGWLGAMRLEPGFADGWLRDVPLPSPSVGSSVNVCGIVSGSGALADRWIVAGAHLDHLGRVDPGAAGVPAPGAYFPGAGDNAAGVAALLHVAEAAVQASGEPGDRRSLLVCGFGAEEIGMVGSRHLAADPPVPIDRLDAMVNLDAVGRLAAGPLYVAGIESSPDFADLVAAAAGDDVSVSPQSAALVGSDHASFLARKIPALFLFTGPYVEMNSPADSLAAVDLAGLATVAATAARIVDALRQLPDAPAFVPLQPAPPLPAAGNRETWFGSAPDFSDGGVGGYRIAGLSVDGPAARAGLAVGDVLVRLGDEPVTDLATFTAALRRHAPGAVVEVVVEREGRRLAFPVTLGDRRQRLR